MLMSVNHLLDTIDTVPTISPTKSKISPARKIELHKQEAEDPRETASSKEESDIEYKLEFPPNQLVHTHQTLSPHKPKKSSIKTTQF